ncbi:MAG: MFS transporter [Candidatus Abyssubacteria bacterium]
MNKSAGIYYGWWIVGACSLILFVCAGIGFSTLPVFFDYLLEDISESRRVISFAGTIAAVAAGLSAPLVGWVVDRRGPRAVMLFGTVLLSVAFILLGGMTRPRQLHILYLLVGFGLTATTLIPCQTLISRWFELRRGRAMGIITMGNAVGTAVWIFVASRMIDAVGWRLTYGIFGIIIATVSLPLIFFVIRTSPQSMGMERGDQADLSENRKLSAGQLVVEEPGYTIMEVFRTASFWLIFSATFFVVFASSGFGLHAIPFLTEQGIPHTRASAIWMLVHLVSIVSRLFFGYVSEKYQKRYFASAANISRTVCLASLILFALGQVPGSAAVLLLVSIYGVGMGCNAVMNPLIISETFGVKSFGKIMGALALPYTIGMGLGMYAGGHLFDLLENYNVAFIVFAFSFVLAGISVAFARPHFLLGRQSALREAHRRPAG